MKSSCFLITKPLKEGKMIQERQASIKKAFVDVRLSLAALEAALFGPGPSPSQTGIPQLRASQITARLLDLIEITEGGITTEALIEALTPFTTSPKPAVKRAITRQRSLGRIKRVNGRWVPINASGDADRIPQRSGRAANSRQRN
jgi:hypothetical protein